MDMTWHHSVEQHRLRDCCFRKKEKNDYLIVICNCQSSLYLQHRHNQETKLNNNLIEINKYNFASCDVISHKQKYMQIEQVDNY